MVSSIVSLQSIFRFIYEMNLGKVLAQTVPYHARVYPRHTPVTGINTAREIYILYKEDLQKEPDDGDGDYDYDDEEAPIAEIKRAHVIAGTVTEERREDYEHRVFNHYDLSCIILRDERIHIRKNGWSIKDFKIFHIWNVSLCKKPQSHWSIRCQRETNIIEVEINDGGNENETKLVDFILDSRECDKSLSVIVDDCEVNYSLFSDALRVELEIRPYDADGNPVLNVSGHVRVHILLGGTTHEIILFHGENKREKSKHMSSSDALLLRNSTLIIPRGFVKFTLDVSLNGDAGKFLVRHDTGILSRSIAVDEQHYITGEEGYIILTIKWACLCVDQGVCVCPSGTAVGDIAAFQAKYNYSISEDISEDEEDSSEDEEYSSEDDRPVKICKEYGRKRAKIRRINSSSSWEITSNFDEEDSASQETTCDEEDGE